MPEQLNDKTFQDKILNEAATAVVCYTASWCGPCRKVQEILPDLARALAARDAGLFVADVDEVSNASLPLGLPGVPAFYIFEKGHVSTAMIGAVRDVATFIEWYDGQIPAKKQVDEYHANDAPTPPEETVKGDISKKTRRRFSK